MSEIIANMSHTADQDPVNLDEAFVRMNSFLSDNVPHLSRMFGHEISIKIGDAWATDMQTGEVTADPRFFYERGYSEDESCYATMHEINAHLDEVVTQPELTQRVMSFMKKGEAESIFYNVFSDIAGNNRTHAVLPRMADVAADLYDDKLFPDNADARIKDQPKHLQFLYSIIRSEMIPDGFTIVDSEVRAAIEGLRDFQGQGDLIKYSTEAINSSGQALSSDQRFDIWTKVIYPVFLELKTLDEQSSEPDQQPDATQPGESQSSAQSDPSEQVQSETEQQDKSDSSAESTDKSDTDSQPEGQKPSDQPSSEPGQPTNSERSSDQFEQYYQDYFENKHPEPLSHEEHDKLHEYVKNKQRVQQVRPEKKLEERLRAETGHSLADKQHYDTLIEQWIDSIDEMRDVFKSVVQERISIKKALSRQSKTEGAMLNPNTLAQTAIDIASGVSEPVAFLDYELQKRSGEMVGKTDWVFVFDASGSMFYGNGDKAKATEASAVISMEGLRAMQRDVEHAEAEHGIDLELDIRTSVYVFGNEATKVKDLSTGLSEKERYDTASLIRRNAGGTADFLALEDIAELPKANDRRRIVVVVSDGESNDPQKATQAIEKLRKDGWEVIGISIGSDEAERLYSPTSKRTDDPAELPGTIKKLIEESYALHL